MRVLAETLAAVRELAQARTPITGRAVAAKLGKRAPRRTALSMRLSLLEARGAIRRVGRDRADNFRSRVFELVEHPPSVREAIASGALP